MRDAEVARMSGLSSDTAREYEERAAHRSVGGLQERLESFAAEDAWRRRIEHGR